MLKKRNEKQTNYNLFEPTSSSDARATETQESSESSQMKNSSIDPTACPKCGGKSLKSVRPIEEGGSHYCPQCPSETGAGCLYFMPGEQR